MAYAFNDDKSKAEVITVRKSYTAQSSSPTIVYTFAELGLTVGKHYTGFATMGSLMQGLQVGCSLVSVAIHEIDNSVSISTSLASGATADIRFMFFEL